MQSSIFHYTVPSPYSMNRPSSVVCSVGAPYLQG